jgi:hypothetical protein
LRVAPHGGSGQLNDSPMRGHGLAAQVPHWPVSRSVTDETAAVDSEA